MTERAVLLPTPGEPYLLSYWLRNWRTWGPALGLPLYVCVTRHLTYGVLTWVRRMLDEAGADVTWVDWGEHGDGLRVLLERCPTEYVLLAEDDAYVRDGSAVPYAFGLLRDGAEVVGSPRGSCSQELLDAARERWPWTDEPTLAGDVGPALWPAFLFARRDLLLRAGELAGTFGARSWVPGEEVAGLEHVCQAECGGDTLVPVSFVIRDLVHPRHVVSLSHPRGVLEGDDPSWFHVGSLSSGPLSQQPAEAFIDAGTPGTEWARRLFWWRRFALTSTEPGPHGYRAWYLGQADRLSELACVDDSTVARWADTYMPMLTWEGA